MPNSKAYTRKNWAAYPSKTTPITAANLNVMDKGIDDIDDRVVSVLNRLDTDESNITSQGSAIAALGNDVAALNVWTTPVSCAVGDTTVTIQDENILTTSVIDAYSENASGTPLNIESIVVTTGQAVLTFGALEAATTIKLHIMN
jgi:hypothetical protein